MYPEFNGIKICRVRLIISFIALVGLFVSILCWKHNLLSPRNFVHYPLEQIFDKHLKN